MKKIFLLAMSAFIITSCSKTNNNPENNNENQQNAGLQLQQKFNVAGSGSVIAVARQHDGKLILATSNKGLMRVNIDGTADNQFNPHVDIKNIAEFCTHLRVLDDGRLLVGFRLPKAYTDAGYRALYRLNNDGTIDNSFVVNIKGGHQSTTQINATLPLNDGSIIVAGSFYKTDDAVMSGYHLTKLSSTGRFVSDFTPNIVSQSLNDFIGLYRLHNNHFLATGAGYTNSQLGPQRQHAIEFNNDGVVEEKFNFREQMYVEFPAPRVKMIKDVEQLKDDTYLFVGDLDNVFHIGMNGNKLGNVEFSNRINSIEPIADDKFLLGSVYSGRGSFDIQYKDFLSVYNMTTNSVEHLSLGFDSGGVLEILRGKDNSLLVIGYFTVGNEEYNILRLTL